MISLVGYIPYQTGQRSGFVIPAVSINNRDIYVQRGSLHSFTRPTLQRVEIAGVFELAPIAGAYNPDVLNYGFLLDKAGWIVGAGEGMRTMIQSFVGESELDAGVRMQIAELWESPQEKVACRQRMIAKLTQEYGTQVSASFAHSALPHSTMWDLISKFSRPSGDINKLARLRVRAVMALDLATESLLPDGIWTELERVLSISRNVLISSLREECPFADNSRSIPRHAIGEADFESSSYVTMHQLSKLKRQEQRVACILSRLIDDPVVTLDYLALYRDRGEFANTAIDIIQSEFHYENSSRELRELLVAKLVSRFYSKCFPMQRGQYLFDMATILGHHPTVAEAIRAKAERSASIYVGGLRSDIIAALSKRD